MNEATIDGVAKGGEGVTRDDDGRVVFVRGALPGERVRFVVDEERKSFGRGHVVEVLDAHPRRVDPPCEHVATGCGGCDLQHASSDLQQELKLRIVAEALERIGGVDEVELDFGGSVAPLTYRTTLRCLVVDGKAGFRRQRENYGLPTPNCQIAHPLAAEIMRDGSFPGADEISIRVGAGTGDRLVIVEPSVNRSRCDAEMVGADELTAGKRAWITERVADRSWRVSARSFFQPCPEAAELLSATVRAKLGPVNGTLVDLYSGVGLLAGTADARGPIVTVETSRSAVADARINLGDRETRVIRASVEAWKPPKAEAVVADPARSGLAKAGVATVVGAKPDRVVLVSCDPAAFARDTALLVGAGYRIATATLLDLFPQTSHIEVVALFRRDS